MARKTKKRIAIYIKLSKSQRKNRKWNRWAKQAARKMAADPYFPFSEMQIVPGSLHFAISADSKYICYSQYPAIVWRDGQCPRFIDVGRVPLFKLRQAREILRKECVEPMLAQVTVRKQILEQLQ